MSQNTEKGALYWTRAKKPTTFAHWSFLSLCVCVRNENGIRVWYAHRCREHVLPQMWCLMKIWGYGEVMEGAADTACCLRCSGVRMRRLLTRVDCGQSQRRGRQWRSRGEGGGNAGASPQSREPRNRLDELTYSIRRPLQNSWIYSYKKHEQGPNAGRQATYNKKFLQEGNYVRRLFLCAWLQDEERVNKGKYPMHYAWICGGRLYLCVPPKCL